MSEQQSGEQAVTHARSVNTASVGRWPTYSHAIVAGDTIYLSGVLGTDADRIDLVEGGVEAQTARAFDHVAAVLEEAGASLLDVIKVTVYLADISDFLAMDTIYAQRLPHAPARVTVEAKLALDAAVEVEVIAYNRRLRGDDRS
jgi:2-iminobutanoate/2-iminopropanoate deaminase